MSNTTCLTPARVSNPMRSRHPVSTNVNVSNTTQQKQTTTKANKKQKQTNKKANKQKRKQTTNANKQKKETNNKQQMPM